MLKLKSRNPLIRSSSYDLFRRVKDNFKYYQWKKDPVNKLIPNRVKQNTVIYYFNQYHPETLIETGTYFGDMVNAVKDYFKYIYSIELDDFLFKRAVNRFQLKHHIKIIHGNSKDVLKDLITKISGRALFWLDAHYSAGITARGDKITPIIDELEVILNNKTYRHIILIDDARLFNGIDDYPGIDELKRFILSKNSSAGIDIKDDIIRIIQ